MPEIVSRDRAVQALARRWHEVIAAQAAAVAYMTAYGGQIRYVTDSLTEISPLEHYNMLDQDDCGCPTCVDWVQRRSEFLHAVTLIPKGHRWTVCGCDTCRFVGRFQLNLLAAANRRELLIEMSFHARYHSRHGPLVMDWLQQEMQNPSYTINWCAQEMSRFPMDRWLRRCEMAVSGVVSGAVFRNSTMVTEMIANIGSSLVADVDWSP